MSSDDDRLEVIADRAALDRALERLDAGRGPVAVDAERASGYRYSDRAYLVQLYRRGSGTFIVDPLPFESLAEINEVIAHEEWVFHAATQDLPSLRAIGMDPEVIFDTELGARLLGMERVGLASVVENLLGVHLAKAHSAADWSTRPLPRPWLEYAAADVELLVDARDIMAELFASSGKAGIAEEEFASVLARDLTPKRDEPWRRLSGLSKLRNPRQLAIARELWVARDDYARETDTAPGRLVPDRSLAAVAAAMPRSIGELQGMREFTGRASRTQLPRWWAAVERGRATDDLPARRVPNGNGMPPHRVWAQRAPEADARLRHARAAVGALAEDMHMPVENLLTPDTLRRVCWSPPEPVTPDSIAGQLLGLGAREWQVQATAGAISNAIIEAESAEAAAPEAAAPEAAAPEAAPTRSTSPAHPDPQDSGLVEPDQ